LKKEAFNGLTQLKVLDLSYNQFKLYESILSSDLPCLEKLLLSGNKFENINSRDFLMRFNQLRIFDLMCARDNDAIDFYHLGDHLDFDNYLSYLSIGHQRRLISMYKIELNSNFSRLEKQDVRGFHLPQLSSIFFKCMTKLKCFKLKNFGIVHIEKGAFDLLRHTLLELNLTHLPCLS
jgi:hypothetical protein